MKKFKFILPILLIANILCMMDVSIMTIVIPEIQSAFNESLSDLSWTVNVYTIVFAALIIPFGRLAEQLGRNRLVFIGLMTFGLGSLITGLSPNLTVMLIARGIQSIGAAIIIPTSMVIGLEQGGDQNRNKVIAALAGAQGLAVAVGPTVGGFISQYGNWRWVFYINIPFILILLLVYPFVLNIKHESRRIVKIDWIGTVLSCVSLTTLSLGLIKGNDWGWSSITTLASLTIAITAFVLFLLQENHTAFPMINLKLFKRNDFKAASLALLLSNYFMGGMVILIPTMLTKVQGESELHAALLITPYSIAVMITVILTSMIVKKISNQLLIGSGFIIIAVSYYLMSHLNLQNNYNTLITAAILLGIGYGLVAATANILVAADFHGSQLTDANSVANILRQVGLIIAIALFTSVLTNNMKTAKQSTLTYAHEEINKTHLATPIKHKFTKKINDKLDTKSSSTTDTNQTINLNTNPSKIESVALQSIYQKQLRHVANQSHLTVAQLPTPLKENIKNNVTKVALPKIRQQEQINEKTVQQTITSIKGHLKTQSRQAFMSVYQTMSIIPVFSLLLLLLLKKHKKISD
ncbi:MAG: MFS transporter [Leuconostoc carnosum]|uniref:MFS transporter n=1 Tax=Leuconostoc carnosum TaxID=1252 RepID=UPI003F95FA88